MAKVDTKDWGTKKGIARIQVVTGWNPSASPETMTVTLSPYVPAGTKAVTLWIDGVCSAADRYVRPCAYGTTDPFWELNVQVANVPMGQVGDVELDSNYRFDLIAETSGFSSIDAWITAVYL